MWPPSSGHLNFILYTGSPCILTKSRNLILRARSQFSQLVHVVAKQDYRVCIENTKFTQKKRQALKSLLEIALGLLIDFTTPDL